MTYAVHVTDSTNMLCIELTVQFQQHASRQRDAP